jgi:hypothetical protein
MGGRNDVHVREQFKVVGLCWGMSAGKNFTSEIMVTYTMYRLLLLVNLHRYFGLDSTSTIDILNISFVNERQAAEIFFDRLKQTIRATFDPDTGRNWFEQHGVDLRDRGIGYIKKEKR